MSEKMIRKTAVMEVIKAHMDGEDKNTKAVLSDVMESVNDLETLEQEPTEKPMTVDVLDKIRDEIEQKAWEIAISDTDRANGMWDAYRIIDKYKGDKE